MGLKQSCRMSLMFHIKGIRCRYAGRAPSKYVGDKIVVNSTLSQDSIALLIREVYFYTIAPSKIPSVSSEDIPRARPRAVSLSCSQTAPSG